MINEHVCDLTRKWNDEQFKRYRELLPEITTAVVNSKSGNRTDRTFTGWEIVRIAYGIVCAEHELQNLSLKPEPQT